MNALDGVVIAVELAGLELKADDDVNAVVCAAVALVVDAGIEDVFMLDIESARYVPVPAVVGNDNVFEVMTRDCI